MFLASLKDKNPSRVYNIVSAQSYVDPQYGSTMDTIFLHSQVAKNHRPLYPKVAQKSLKVAQNYRPPAFQVDCSSNVEGQRFSWESHCLEARN